jgi:Rrf2 family iron-sulfur cluster assembly transcriptional regulator
VDEPLDATQCGGKGNCHGDDEQHGRCMTHDLWANLNTRMVEYLASVSLRDLVAQQAGRGQVIHDLRERKVKAEPIKLMKAAPVALAKKETSAAVKPHLVNSVFNLARQS